MDPYSTHLPVLEKHVRPGSHVVEFGCGMFSTPLMVSRCGSVTSIEMQDQGWLIRVMDHLKPAKANWRPVLSLGPWEFLSVPLPDRIDLAFVDGHGESRHGVVNYLMRLRVPVIIAHDTEESRYGWGKITDYDYSRVDYTEHKPHTTLWTLN